MFSKCNISKCLKALTCKYPCADAINHRGNGRMCGALQQIDGNRRFRGIIHAECNAYSLNPRLIYQAGDIGFLHGDCVIDLVFRNRWKCLVRCVSKIKRVRTPSIVGAILGPCCQRHVSAKRLRLGCRHSRPPSRTGWKNPEATERRGVAGPL